MWQAPGAVKNSIAGNSALTALWFSGITMSGMKMMYLAPGTVIIIALPMNEESCLPSGATPKQQNQKMFTLSLSSSLFPQGDLKIVR